MHPGVYTYSIGHEAPLGLFIVTYLFLTSVSEGLIILAAYGWWRNTAEWQRIIVPAVAIGWITAAIAPFNLLLDLAQPFNFFNLYTSFNPMSPLSWGSWILLGYETTVAVFAWGVIRLHIEKQGVTGSFLKTVFAIDILPTGKNGQAIHLLARLAGLAAAFFAVALMLYTGALVSIPFSRTLAANLLVPVLYLASALAVGAAIFLWLARDEGGKMVVAGLKKLLVGSLVVELAVLGLILANTLAPESYGYTALSRMFAAHKAIFVLELLLGIVTPMAIVLGMRYPNFGLVIPVILIGSFATRLNLVAGLHYVTLTEQEFVQFEYEWIEGLMIAGLIASCVLLSFIAVKYLHSRSTSICDISSNRAAEKA
ncbi:MAG: polysulfide reductase NrfD [Negativicutes bacterium]|nr:polysulfide reductase NrfD [Negativicutes bacterium]